MSTFHLTSFNLDIDKMIDGDETVVLLMIEYDEWTQFRIKLREMHRGYRNVFRVRHGKNVWAVTGYTDIDQIDTYDRFGMLVVDVRVECDDLILVEADCVDAATLPEVSMWS